MESRRAFAVRLSRQRPGACASSSPPTRSASAAIRPIRSRFTIPKSRAGMPSFAARRRVYLLADLASSNGTYVNGQRIDDARAGQRRPGASRQHAAAVHGDRRRMPTATSGDKIDIIARQQADDRSRIVRSMSQEAAAGCSTLDFDDAASPWLAHGAQPSADHVPHGAGRQPHARHRSTARPHHAVDLRVGRSRPRLHHAARSEHQEARSPRCAATARASRGEKAHDQQDDPRLRACSATKAC